MDYKVFTNENGDKTLYSNNVAIVTYTVNGDFVPLKASWTVEDGINVATFMREMNK